MELFTSEYWKDYELIDSGGLEKLERFGKYTLARPEPQAVWDKALPETKWDQLAHAHYRRVKGQDPAKLDFAEKGDWSKKSIIRNNRASTNKKTIDANVRERLHFTPLI